VIGRIRAHQRLLARRQSLPAPLPWHLIWLPVCASTEHRLGRMLRQGAGGRAGALPLAVIARRQRWGRGQAGRRWSAPPGGAWLSAAFAWPWDPDPEAAADPALAVAEGLARQIERLGLRVQLKWPNDLLVGRDKLAGLLPRRVLRGGRVRHVRVGVGVNGRNRAPGGGVALADLLEGAGPEPTRLTAMVLCALEWAIRHAAQPQLVRRAAERRLRELGRPLLWQGRLWQVEGLSPDGGLRLRDGRELVVRRRRF
jgi:BirA family biotin operon repressor/biotin-[acetyl-CoA-carboxylase] ligase